MRFKVEIKPAKKLQPRVFKDPDGFLTYLSYYNPRFTEMSIYITSDEKIGPNDAYLTSAGPFICSHESERELSNFRKIVATTEPFLNELGVPGIKSEDIEYVCSFYNNGKTIDDLELSCMYSSVGSTKEQLDNNMKVKLQVDSSNCVIFIGTHGEK